LHEDIEQDNAKQARKACKRLTFLSVFKAHTNKFDIFRQYAYIVYMYAGCDESCSRNIANKTVQLK